MVERIKNRVIRALAKAITMVENDHPEKWQILSVIFSLERKARYIGNSGSSGTGKSSLVNRMITHIRNEGKTVAVIAVDLTSPFSDGALLGDRFGSNAEGERKRKMQQELEVYEPDREEIWRDVKFYIESHDQLSALEADGGSIQLARDWFDSWKKEGGFMK